MLREVLKKHIKSQASFVEVGYGQVPPIRSKKRSDLCSIAC